MINVAKYRKQNATDKKKAPNRKIHCNLGLNPSFQRMEETIRAFNKIENYLLLAWCQFT
jgi:hypothetical protein